MAENFVKLQTKLLREYYKDFSKYAKGRLPKGKVAWVTAFTPVEILEALGIDYYYPESYAAVIAASGMEPEFLKISDEMMLVRDCCSYSCCFNGSLDAKDGPRGIPPKPDVLIATNNQCNTLPNWWNTLADRYDVPLIVIDYPGETLGEGRRERTAAFDYVTKQHKNLAQEMERLGGNMMDEDRLAGLIQNSRASVQAWKGAAGMLSRKKIRPTILFDNINFLITARCKEETAQMYDLMASAMEKEADLTGESIPAFWLGYPLWYHKDRYLSEVMDGFQVVGSNYLTWWDLDYRGEDIWEQLFEAYNFTFLNLTQDSRDRRLLEAIEASGAKAAITLRNKSCKCDLVSAKNINIPQAELDMDMIDRAYLDLEKARKALELLKETVKGL